MNKFGTIQTLYTYILLEYMYISIYTLSDLGVLSILIGSLSR